MKKIRISIILSLLVIVLSSTTLSQSKPNSLYLEFFGSGGLYSVNYDRLFSENFGVRIGFMYFEADWLIFFIDAEMFLIPATLNYLVGTGKHKFELGAGPLFVFGSARFLGGESVSGSGVGWTGTIGYRYQKNEGGFMWRIGFTPAFFSGEIFPSGGISLGFSF
jgi:hypothetical protein